MSNLIKSEWYKLKRERSLWALTLLLFLVSVFYPLLILFGGGTEVVKVSDIYELTALGGNDLVLRIAPCILAGFFISSEYSIGTMKSMAASGNSRIRIYFANLLVYTIGAVIIALIFPVVMTGAGAIFFNFNNMPGLGYFVQTIGLTILYTAAFASIMAMFATIFTDTGTATGVMIIFFLIFDSILYTISDFITLFEQVANNYVGKLFLDIVNIDAYSGGERLQLVLVPVVTIFMFGIIGSMLFQKKEIK